MGQASDEWLERFGALQEQIEYLLEEVGQENKFRTELSEYVRELRDEAGFIRTARKVFGVIATLTGIGLLCAPVIISVNNYGWFQALPDYPKSALIIGMLAAGVVTILSLTKSVYRSASERHGDEFIPPQIKLIHELMNGVKGG